MKKLLLVFNPNSGKGLIKNNLMQIIQILSDAEYEVTVYPTKKANDGYEKVLADGGDYDLVVCSGGDGTLNEVVGAVLRLENKPKIGYIPSGSTNDFAASLNIDKNMIQAAKAIANGNIYPVDIGLVYTEGEYERSFNYVAAFGAFTQVSYNTPQELKNILGHQAYVFSGAKELLNLKPTYMSVSGLDENGNEFEYEGNFLYGMVSNTQSVGGMKGIIGNTVDLQDGIFEVLLVKEIKTPLDAQELLAAYVTQDYDKCNMVYNLKTSHISFKSKEDVDWTFDGEYGGARREVTYKVMEAAVDFLI